VNEEQELKEAQEHLREVQARFEDSQRKKLEEARISLANQELEEQRQVEEQRQLQEQLQKEKIEKEEVEKQKLAKQEAQRVVLDSALANAESENIQLLKKQKLLEGDTDREQELRSVKKQLLVSEEKCYKAKEVLRLYMEEQQRLLDEKISKQKEQDAYWLQVRVAKQESLDAERRNKEKEVRDLESSIARREAAKRERAEAEAKEAERSAQSAFNAEQECVTTLRRNFIRGDQTTSNPLQRFFQQTE
jgi:hypothetical protein